MKNLRLYKPNKTGNGCASSWELSYKEQEKWDKYQMFLVIAPQEGDDDKGNNKFGWKTAAITVNLGEPDISSLLATIDRRQPESKLFHESPAGGNKGISLVQNDKGGFYLNVSYQDKEKKLTKYSHSIAPAEAAILSVLLKRAIEIIYDW